MSDVFTPLICERLSARSGDAFVFLSGAGEEERRVDAGELQRHAFCVANFLRDRYEPGSRILLIQPPGFDFVRCLLGCMYAGMIAVPNYPPRRRESPERLTRVCDDSGAVCVLVHSELLDVTRFIEAWPIDRFCVDRLELEDTRLPELTGLRPETVAYLQYTSGSTGTPRGVMVTNGNLLDNSAFLYRTLGADSIETNVLWLPPYHDFGLVLTLQSLYAGALCVLMPPSAFAQKPVRWLQAISRYRGNSSAGPNFAYELCLRSITDEQLAGLDLESWMVAIIASDQVEPSTIREFTQRFASVGFRSHAFSPCYGLAEATLGVTTTEPHELPRQLAVTHNLKPWTVMESGAAHERVAIVDPVTRAPVEPGRVGEIWVTGGSVTPGYWNQPELSQATVGNVLAGTASPTYLRTGDLGLVHDGRLFFVSREKDLVILGGRNLYPADLEAAASRAHPSLCHDRAAAFSIAIEQGEGLVLVLELNRVGWQRIDAAAVVATVELQIVDEFGVMPHDIVLLRPRAIPATLNGKVARHRVKELYLAGALSGRVEIARRAREAAESGAVERWLEHWLSRALAVDVAQLHARPSLVELGLDSLTAARCAAALGREFGLLVPRYAALLHSSVSDLARYVATLGRPETAVQPQATRERFEL